MTYWSGRQIGTERQIETVASKGISPPNSIKNFGMHEKMMSIFHII